MGVKFPLNFRKISIGASNFGVFLYRIYKKRWNFSVSVTNYRLCCESILSNHAVTYRRVQGTACQRNGQATCVTIHEYCNVILLSLSREHK